MVNPLNEKSVECTSSRAGLLRLPRLHQHLQAPIGQTGADPFAGCDLMDAAHGGAVRAFEQRIPARDGGEGADRVE